MLKEFSTFSTCENCLPDLLEIRLDFFRVQDFEDLKCALSSNAHSSIKIPLILTARSSSEGGRNPELTDEERLRYLEEFLPFAAYVDLEIAALKNARLWDAFVSEIHHKKKKLIASFHNFHFTPALAELKMRVQEAVERKADVCKIATFLQTESDIQILSQLLREQNAGFPLAVMGMGDAFGVTSRLQFVKEGSVLNYGYLNLESQEVDPTLGQPSIAKLKGF